MSLLRSSFLRLARLRLIDCTGRALPLYADCGFLPIKLISEISFDRPTCRVPDTLSARRPVPAARLLLPAERLPPSDVRLPEPVERLPSSESRLAAVLPVPGSFLSISYSLMLPPFLVRIAIPSPLLAPRSCWPLLSLPPASRSCLLLLSTLPASCSCRLLLALLPASRSCLTRLPSPRPLSRSILLLLLLILRPRSLRPASHPSSSYSSQSSISCCFLLCTCPTCFPSLVSRCQSR